MTAEQIFGMSSKLALAGWLLLLIFPRARWTARLVCGFVIPALFGVIYTGLIAAHWGESRGNFSSLAGVSALFGNPWLLLAGWVHYLAFDLFVGSWEVRDSIERNIPRLLVAPCLILTFLFGPIGFLLYGAVRQAHSRFAQRDSGVSALL